MKGRSESDGSRPSPAEPTADEPEVGAPAAITVGYEPMDLSFRPADLLRYGIYSLLIVALSAGTALLIATQQADVYGVRSEILFERRSENSTGFLREDRNLTTQVVILSGYSILEPVARANDLTVDELSDKLDVNIVESSEVIRIEVEDTSPAMATKLVSAITDRYLAGAESSASDDTKEFLESELARVGEELGRQQERSAELEKRRIDSATAANPNPPAGVEQIELTARIQSLLDQETDLRSKLDSATIESINRPRVDQITQPYRLEDPVSPRPSRAVAAGALAGAVIAAVVVALLARKPGPEPDGP